MRTGLFLLFIWFVWFVWLNETNQTNKSNQMNQVNPSRSSNLSRSAILRSVPDVQTNEIPACPQSVPQSARSLSDIAVRHEAKEGQAAARLQASKNRRRIRRNTLRIFLRLRTKQMLGHSSPQ